MLYLVNAAESPEAAGYVAPEMELLAWIGKPVIVLLNQLGPPRAGARGRRARPLAGAPRRLPGGARVLPLDAFARCWVQEATLLAAVEQALDGERRARDGAPAAPPGAARAGSAFAASMAVDRREPGAGRARRRAPAGAPAGSARACAAPAPRIGWARRRRARRPRRRRQALARAARRRGARRARQALIRLHGLEGSAEGDDPGAAVDATTRCACASTKARRRSGAASSAARWSASRPTC